MIYVKENNGVWVDDGDNLRKKTFLFAFFREKKDEWAELSVIEMTVCFLLKITLKHCRLQNMILFSTSKRIWCVIMFTLIT